MFREGARPAPSFVGLLWTPGSCGTTSLFQRKGLGCHDGVSDPLPTSLVKALGSRKQSATALPSWLLVWGRPWYSSTQILEYQKVLAFLTRAAVMSQSQRCSIWHYCLNDQTYLSNAIFTMAC